MRLNLLIIGICALVAFGIAWFMDQASQPSVRIIQTPVVDMKEPAPVVAFKDITGMSHALSDFKEHAVILNFWASWCAPCRVEMPQLFEIASRYKDNLTLVLVSVDSDQKAIEDFFRTQKLKPTTNIIVVHDPRKAISKGIFGTLRYPESILIDRTGIMRRKIVGGVDWNAEDIQTSITAILAKP